MKLFISIPIFSLFLLTVSCRKDAITTSVQPCTNCSPTPVVAISGPIFINDSNWVKQSDGTFKSDITALILKAGGEVEKLYSLEILDEGNLYQIYPNAHAEFLGGSFYGSVVKYYDNEICTITYKYFDPNNYSGELPNGGLLPFRFRSLAIRVLMTK
jgi:hypothetical protein